jgi:glycerophosphoryl diester phosphodiesterase
VISRRKLWLGLALLLAGFVYLNNTSIFSAQPSGKAVIFAHRGIGQRYDVPIESMNTCIAVHLLPPKHGYLENTIPSMRAAFEQGADVVEFDIRRTKDARFAVFHDPALECKTNGDGLIRAHTMQELAALDIGYGYTFDRGRTYPFRGKGLGLMPSMDEVFENFPGKSFLIDLKDNEESDAHLLADQLAGLSELQRTRLMIFARDTGISVLRERLPEVRIFSARSTASCLLRYIAYGWTGVMPAPCVHSPQWLPINMAPWFWGWPRRFMNRFEAYGSSIIVMGAYPASEISPGVDTSEDLARLPAEYDGGIWTNDVGLVASRVREQERSKAGWLPNRSAE